MALDGKQAAGVLRETGFFTGDAEQQRRRGTEHVGVEQADLFAEGGQRHRQIGGGGEVPHAALAGGHGHDPFHPRDAADRLRRFLGGQGDEGRADFLLNGFRRRLRRRARIGSSASARAGSTASVT